MSLDISDFLRPSRKADEEVIAAPLGGTRAQRLQRLQVGFFGLLAMILIVGLANIIMENAQYNQTQVVPQAASTVAPEPEESGATDPLADAGVVPDLPADTQSAGQMAQPPTGEGNAAR